MHDQPAGDQDLQQRVGELEVEVAELRRQQVRLQMARGYRKRSRTTLFGLPLYDIAVGPDPERGEIRGHARGVFAFGDIASGVFAVGGLAVGVVAIGGGAIGLVGALGGFALGGVAVGGAAIGAVAIGGGALGYYALGGGAAGVHVISGIRQDPEAVRFFSQWVPGFTDWLRSVGR
jgi:hypothetical protein